MDFFGAQLKVKTVLPMILNTFSAHDLVTLKALELTYFLTKLLSDGMVKYHGPPLSSGQPLKRNKLLRGLCVWRWGVMSNRITHYTGENKCNAAHESH